MLNTTETCRSRSSEGMVENEINPGTQYLDSKYGELLLRLQCRESL